MRFPRLLTCFLAVSALVIGAVVPAAAATASVSASGSSSASIAKAAVDPVSAGMVKSTLAGFEAGNIISDAVFTNAGTMSEAQIQAFFNSKVSSCQSGYVCIKDFRITSVTRPADAYCDGYTGAANESAARIIYRVAQSCNINPQVLIVMLQKEQGLITHTWPSAWRYNIALGQGCPDTAPCDPNYIGFFHQIYGAARQMQIYMEGKWFQWYAPGRTWNILYNPNANCGSSPVYIANKATSALYYYTPYQPNAAAMRAGYGEGDGCSAYGNRNFYNYFTDWFGSTQASTPSNQGNPIGRIDSVSSVAGEIRVMGWALDPDTSASIDVHVYVDGVGYQTTANSSRPDLAAHYPGLGIAHGYTISIPPTKWGSAEVCAYGINVGQGSNQLLGCTTVTTYGGNPLGNVDGLTAGAGSVTVSGWAFDPDTTDPIEVHVYVGAQGTSAKADKPRQDIAAAYPMYGTNHGYSVTAKAAAGYQTVCIYGINVKSGGNILLAPCSQIFVKAATDPGNVPFGNIDSIDVKGSSVTVRGWALDTDTPDPVGVHIYVGAAGTAHTADGVRKDIAAAYPGYGEAHGFSLSRTLPAGGADVCIYVINDGRGGNALLGCRFVAPAPSSPPVGNIDSYDVQGNTVTVRGWALDPDTKDPIAVHVYVGASGTAHTADGVRKDIAAAYPGFGEQHGVAVPRTLPAGGEQVCVYAINDGAGPDTVIGCRFVVPAATAPQRNPIGSFDGISVVDGRVLVSGWALDPDTVDPIEVHVYVGGTGYAITTDKERFDIAAAYPAFGPKHGFGASLPITGGARNACVYAINNGPGGHTLLGCRSF